MSNTLHHSTSVEKKSKIFELLSNKRNLYKFDVYDSYECGMVLDSLGLKKILGYKVSLNGSHGWIRKNEIFLRNFLEEEVKLLLHKSEIKRIISLVNEKKYSLIPKRVYLRNHKVKLELTLSKINKTNDREKLQKIKEKSWKKVKMDHGF